MLGAKSCVTCDPRSARFFLVDGRKNYRGSGTTNGTIGGFAASRKVLRSPVSGPRHQLTPALGCGTLAVPLRDSSYLFFSMGPVLCTFAARDSAREGCWRNVHTHIFQLLLPAWPGTPLVVHTDTHSSTGYWGEACAVVGCNPRGRQRYKSLTATRFSFALYCSCSVRRLRLHVVRHLRFQQQNPSSGTGSK